MIDVYPAATLEGNSNSNSYPNAIYAEKGYYTINLANVVAKPFPTGSLDYNNSNTSLLNNNPLSNTGAVSQMMYKLDGTSTNQTGLGITLKVMAGDKLDISERSYYSQLNTQPNVSLQLIVILTGLLGATTGATATKGAILGSLTSGSHPTSIPSSLLTHNPVGGDQTPYAYINYIFFDEQFQYEGGNFSRVGGANQVKDYGADAALQQIPVPKNGYVYIYVSNQSPVSVYFDNIQVVHTRVL